MVRLNEQELREEYLSSLETERVEIGLVGFLFFGGVIYLIIRFAPSWWKLFSIIPSILIILIIKEIKEIGERIKVNKENQNGN